MIKKIIKYFIISILSIVMFYTIILGLIGKNNINTVFSTDKYIQVNEIKIDGSSIDLSKLNIKYENEKYYFKEIKINHSKISRISLLLQCENETTIRWNDDSSIICKNSQTEELFSVDYGIKNHFFSYLKNTKHLPIIIFLLIAVTCFNVILVNYYNKIIYLINNESIKMINILLFSILLFICTLFTYNTLLLYFKIANIVIFPILAGYTMFKIRHTLKKYVENAFLVIALFAGTMMIFSIPPTQVPDEQNHFINVYISSEINKKFTYNESGVLAEVPTYLYDFSEKYLYARNNYRKTSYISEIFKKIDNNSKIELYYIQYFSKKTAYIPAIIISFILKLLNSSMLLIFYSCRYINFLIFLLIVYNCIKTIPKFKYILLLCSLLPINIHQICGINQDSINNTLFILLLTLLIKLIYDKKYELNLKRIVLLFIISILLFCCKTIYISILLLLFLIPREKFNKILKNKYNEKIITFIGLFSLLLVCFIIYKYCRPYFPTSNTKTKVVSDLYTMSQTKNNPIGLLRMLKNSTIRELGSDLFWGMFDGFGWLTVWHYDSIKEIMFIIYSILIFSCVDKEEKITKWHHIINITCILIMILAVWYSMLYSYTKYWADTIYGLQPRYFIPVAFLLYIELSSIRLIKLEKKKEYLIPILIIIAISLSFVTIIDYII